jgi:hypothetical protein
MTVPIVLPTEKCVRVPLPDNYTFVIDDGAENSFVALVEGEPSKLHIYYGFEVGTEEGCDPLRTIRLAVPSKFVLVPFYVISENKTPPQTSLWKIGTSKCWGVQYNIFVGKP